MSKFNEKYGPWALVTGASAGLGSEFAKQLARQGRIDVYQIGNPSPRVHATVATKVGCTCAKATLGVPFCEDVHTHPDLS